MFTDCESLAAGSVFYHFQGIRSELKFQRQLDRARPADLIERVESAIGAAGPQTIRQGLRGPAEQGVGQDVAGIAENWVVQYVEELSPETKVDPLHDVKLPLDSDIRLRRIETPQHVASEIPLRSSGRCGKSRLVKNLAARISRTVELRRHPGIQVR